MLTPRLEMITRFAAASLQARVQAGAFQNAPVPGEMCRAAWNDAQAMMAYLPANVARELLVAEQEIAIATNPNQ